MQRVCAQALEQPITFLPALPEAAQLARRSWAYDATATPTSLDEARRLVSTLNDDLANISSVLVRAAMLIPPWIPEQRRASD